MITSLDARAQAKLPGVYFPLRSGRMWSTVPRGAIFLWLTDFQRFIEVALTNSTVATYSTVQGRGGVINNMIVIIDNSIAALEDLKGFFNVWMSTCQQSE